MVELVELSERTLNRIRNYIACESLAGRQTSVSEVVEKVINHALDELETYEATLALRAKQMTRPA